MRSIVFVGLLFSSTVAAAGQDALPAAKELYAAAAYEDALAALGRLHEASAPRLNPDVEAYRAFCLYALGRIVDAEAVTESLMRADPFVQLDVSEASPRIQTMFAEVRKRVLPEAIREEFRTGKSARDANRSAEAEAHFATAHRMLEEARRIGVWSDSLNDISALVEGFLDLTRSHGDGAVGPTAVAKTVPPVEAAVERKPAAAAPVPVGGVKRAYDSSDLDVVPPVAIRQVIPKPSQQLLETMRARGFRSGVLDVLIDETGSVESAAMRVSVDSTYDEIIMMAARRWKYQPAMKAGVPVRYRKAIAITVFENGATTDPQPR
jgi:tetratricopeptide (TPR) repeat protein